MDRRIKGRAALRRIAAELRHLTEMLTHFADGEAACVEGEIECTASGEVDYARVRDEGRPREDQLRLLWQPIDLPGDDVDLSLFAGSYGDGMAMGFDERHSAIESEAEIGIHSGS